MRLNHVRQGSGNALLLLHSLGADLVVWSPVMEALARERDVIAVDMPGFGASPSLPDGVEPSARNLARASIDFCDSLGLDRPHVAGISLGGWVAIECARLGRASSVTALCSAGFWEQPLGPRRNLARAFAQALRPVVPLAMRSERVRRLALSGSIRRPERVPAAEASQLVRAYASSRAYPEASELMRGAVIGDLDDVEVPITLAWGEYDRRVSRPAPGNLPARVRQVELPACGHVPTWDDPRLVAAVILEGSRRLSRSEGARSAP